MTIKYSGSALIMTLLAIAAMVSLVLGIAFLVPQDLRRSQSIASSIQAEYAAWAGVEHGLLLLRAGQENGQNVSVADPSQSGVPYSVGPCDNSPFVATCDLVNRILGTVKTKNITTGLVSLARPYQLTANPLGDNAAANYTLLIWHERQNVGDTGLNGLLDGATSPTDPRATTRTDQNINAVLEPDEIRVLDMSQISGPLTINWQLMPHNIDSGAYVCSATAAHLYGTWEKLAADGTTLTIDPNTRHEIISQEPIAWPGADHPKLILQLTVSANVGDNDCFARYSISGGGNAIVDMGFDVIQSIGVSGGVQRKIRVLVNRENYQPLAILDFGIFAGSAISFYH